MNYKFAFNSQHEPVCSSISTVTTIKFITFVSITYLLQVSGSELHIIIRNRNSIMVY